MDGLKYLATHPDAVIYTVAAALLYPVLFTEVGALVWVVVEAGRFTGEMFSRRWRMQRSVASLETAATAAREHLSAGRTADALAGLAALRQGAWVRRYFERLGERPDVSRPRLLKTLGDTEIEVARRLERTRLLVRIGPMLGLMGTLIPISPALVGLARGDVQTLSDNLVIAFSTTVVGLLIGGLAYSMTAVRDRVYSQDLSDIEYVLDLMEP